MAHPQQLDFIKSFSDLVHEKKKKTVFDILEIGSYEVNASLRKYFSILFKENIVSFTSKITSLIFMNSFGIKFALNYYEFRAFRFTV